MIFVFPNKMPAVSVAKPLSENQDMAGLNSPSGRVPTMPELPEMSKVSPPEVEVKLVADTAPCSMLGGISPSNKLDPRLNFTPEAEDSARKKGSPLATVIVSVLQKRSGRLPESEFESSAMTMVPSVALALRPAVRRVLGTLPDSALLENMMVSWAFVVGDQFELGKRLVGRTPLSSLLDMSNAKLPKVFTF